MFCDTVPNRHCVDVDEKPRGDYVKNAQYEVVLTALETPKSATPTRIPSNRARTKFADEYSKGKTERGSDSRVARKRCPPQELKNKS